MNVRRFIGIVLVVGGILAVTMGGFTYTSESHEADLGPVELSLNEQETVNIPLWAGIAAIAAGVIVFSVKGRD